MIYQTTNITMPFPRIRKLPCEVAGMMDEKNRLPGLTYFNPSSSYPYISIRITDKTTPSVEANGMFLYNRHNKTLRRIETPKDALVPSCGYYQGIEDPRLVKHNGRLWFVATSTHANESMMSQMLLGRFNEDATRIEFTQFIDFGIKPLKNMCPFVWENRLCVIDTYSLTVYELACEKDENDVDVYRAIPVKELATCKGLDRNMMRGSTSPVHLHGNVWGCIVHEHIRQAREKMMSLAYISYWMEFDIERGAVTFLSSPFIVAQWGIEFISGIEYYPERHEVELFLGVNDQLAVIAKAKLFDLRVGY